MEEFFVSTGVSGKARPIKKSKATAPEKSTGS